MTAVNVGALPFADQPYCVYRLDVLGEWRRHGWSGLSFPTFRVFGNVAVSFLRGGNGVVIL